MSTTIIIPEKTNNFKSLEYIDKYLKAGFNVIPLRERAKIPAVKWLKLLENPLTKEELYKRFEINPNLNIGLITGPYSGGLVVVDIDNSAPEELAFLIAENPTVTVKTSRGRHYYYLSKNKLDSIIFDWGEFRSNGLYVVAPPSIHPDGTEYQFIDGYELDQISLLPESVFEFLKVHSKECNNNKSKKLSPSNLIKPELLGENQKLNCISDSTSKLLGEKFKRTYRSPEIAFRVMRLVGVEVSKFGESFRCPIHEENNPSCTLWQHEKNGIIVMKEFHKGDKLNHKGKPNSFALPVVYASYIGKRKEFIELTNSQMVIWWFRALYEIGEIKLPAIKCKSLPNKCPKPAKTVYEGFVLLIRIRSYYDQKYSKETIFAWEFGSIWCGYADKNSIKDGLKWLLQNGYIQKTKEAVLCGKREAALYILGGE